MSDTRKIAPIGAVGSTLIEDMARSLGGLSSVLKDFPAPVAKEANPEQEEDAEEKATGMAVMDNMGGKVDGPDLEGNIPAESNVNDEAIAAAESKNDDNDADDAPIVANADSQEDELSNPLDTRSDNDSNGVVAEAAPATDLPNEVPGKYEELTEDKVEANKEEVAEDGTVLDKVASAEPDSSKKGSKLNKENRETLAQIQALIEKLTGGSEDSSEEKSVVVEETVEVTKIDPIEAKNAEIEQLKAALKAKDETNATVKAELEAKTKQLEELETTTVLVKETVTRLEEKFAEFEAKSTKAADLDKVIEEKTQEYERISKKKLPRPDEVTPDVLVNDLLGTNKARKSYVGMSNAEFLKLDRLK